MVVTNFLVAEPVLPCQATVTGSTAVADYVNVVATGDRKHNADVPSIERVHGEDTTGL